MKAEKKPQPFLELYYGDSAMPPIPAPHYNLNSGAVWIWEARGNWHRARHPSTHKAIAKVLEALEAEEWPPKQEQEQELERELELELE